MTQRYPQELKDRAVRLVAESRDQYESEWKGIESIATKLGIGSTETLRKWVRTAEVNAGERPGLSSQESTEVPSCEPRSESCAGRMRWPILKAAAGFFAAELDRPQR